MKRVIYTLSIIGVVLASFTRPALAEPLAGTGQALEIAPPLLNISGDPGTTVKTKLSLRDVSAIPLTVSNEVNDFVANGEDGSPKILTDSKQENAYSLKNWIKPIPRLSLNSRQIVEVPVAVSIPANASPGGYYAVVRFTAQATEPEKSGVSLSASLGALVFLKVNGDAKEQLEVAEFTTQQDGKKNWLFESAPVVFLERLKNSGTIHLQPKGKVTVKDSFGKVVATVNMNLEGSNVLPGQVRRFTSNLDSSVIGNRFLFGHYTAELSIAYGSKGQTLTSTTSFWVIPYKLILFVIFAFIVLFFAFRRGLGRYNERVIEKARGRRRR